MGPCAACLCRLVVHEDVAGGVAVQGEPGELLHWGTYRDGFRQLRGDLEREVGAGCGRYEAP